MAYLSDREFELETPMWCRISPNTFLRPTDGMQLQRVLGVRLGWSLLSKGGEIDVFITPSQTGGVSNHDAMAYVDGVHPPPEPRVMINQVWVSPDGQAWTPIYVSSSGAFTAEIDGRGRQKLLVPPAGHALVGGPLSPWFPSTSTP